MSSTIWMQDVTQEDADIGAVVLCIYTNYKGDPVITKNKDGVEQATANIYQSTFSYIDLNTYEVLEQLKLIKTSPVDGKKYIKLIFDILKPTVDEFDSWK